MIKIRKSMDRGQAHHGWLDAKHSFSFANYYDPNHMGYGVLRVINEDKIEGGAGFPTHAHKDMEIITYIIEGALEHKDSMGNTAIMRPGEVQKMSAGTGVTHSEFNHLQDKKTHLLQIWILPDKKGYEPGYEQISLPTSTLENKLVLMVSPDGTDNSIKIHQDLRMYVAKNDKESEFHYKSSRQRKTWIQVIKGKIDILGNSAESGDGVAISELDEIKIRSSADSEFLVFDIP